MITYEEIADNIHNPMWRFANLYRIKTVSGELIDFKPLPFQIELARWILVDRYTNILIPKSRRQGASTAIGVIMADVLAFNGGVELALVDKTQQDAKAKVDSIITTAIESLIEKTTLTINGVPSPIFQLPPVTRRKAGVVKIAQLNSKGEPMKESVLTGGKQFRGSGVAFAHISELGTIATSEPKRAQEIISGTIPAASGGVCVIETTVKGGKAGEFYRLVTTAKENKTPSRTDWRIMFLPWWKDPKCELEVPVGHLFRKQTDEYFARLARKEGIKITNDRKKYFWEVNRITLGDRMNEEYPSTLDECFETPIGGAILAPSLDVLETIGRRTENVPWDKNRPVMATWDLGSAQNTVWTIFQKIPDGIVVLEQCCGTDGDVPADIVERVCSTWNIEVNFFPHDAIAPRYAGLPSQVEMWEEAGLENIQVIPRGSDKWTGINHLCDMLRTKFWMSRDGTERGWGWWLQYRSKPEAKADGSYTDEVVHDYSSHWADSLRMIAEAQMCGMLDEYASGHTNSTLSGSNPLFTEAYERISRTLSDIRRNNRFGGTTGW